MPNEDQWTILGQLVEADESSADLVLNVVINRILPLLRLLIGGSIAQTLDDRTPQDTVGDLRFGLHASHEVVLLAANVMRPVDRFEIHECRQFAEARPQAFLHIVGKQRIVRENAVYKGDRDMPPRACPTIPSHRRIPAEPSPLRKVSGNRERVTGGVACD